MVALYKVKFLDTYCTYPVYFYFFELDNIELNLRRLYPRKQNILNETYFIRVIYVNEGDPELVEVMDTAH